MDYNIEGVVGFLRNFIPINILDTKTSFQVTKVVNYKEEAKDERNNKFEALINNQQLYKCDFK